jgi:DNA-binding LytR/AlgR family response regulator
MKLKCIIVDDEPIARRLLQEYIEDIDFLELAGIAENPLKANTILAQQTIDLMFLDINMPKLTGIEFLRASANLPMVIMTTAYAEYATEGFELDVMDYLVKPFSFERFLKACNRARDYHTLKNTTPLTSSTGNTADYFFVKCDGIIEKVLYNDLVYVEAMLNYIVLHTEKRKMMVYLTIKSIAEQLPADVFLKVHKSYIINLRKVTSIQGNEISLGHAKVTISQHFYEKAMKDILKNRMIKR